MARYVQLLVTELHRGAPSCPEKKLSSIYFGGGTPSLLSTDSILTLIKEIANAGFEFLPQMEITIEINPGTIDAQKLDLYLAAGINRFSVGVQTFDEKLLRLCGREHSADDSRSTLQLLSDQGVNYSFDLLFGLPGQSLSDLAIDLDELARFSPPHVSLYNLTVPQQHFMNLNRANDETQADMFDLIDQRLSREGIFRYELSNFAKSGNESQHNLLYWSDLGYWGLGVSAHSYFPSKGPFGTRFWNPTSAKQYLEQTQGPAASPDRLPDRLPKRQVEELKVHEAATDFCHTHLRVMRGLSVSQLEKKFPPHVVSVISGRLRQLETTGLLEADGAHLRLSATGRPVANQIFLKLTFLDGDFSA